MSGNDGRLYCVLSVARCLPCVTLSVRQCYQHSDTEHTSLHRAPGNCLTRAALSLYFLSLSMCARVCLYVSVCVLLLHATRGGVYNTTTTVTTTTKTTTTTTNTATTTVTTR